MPLIDFSNHDPDFSSEQVEQCRRIVDGVSKAQTESPDIILMDMDLPILDGWAATQKLKSSPETQSIPVIALTAHAMAGDRERALEAGCDDYDTKPVEFSRLITKMETLLGGSC